MTKVRIQTSILLNNRFNLSSDGLEKKHAEVLELWSLSEKKILLGLTKITGLKFLKNYVDVFLINDDNQPSISHPTIVKVDSDVDDTMCTIVHELIHTLIWDNTAQDNWYEKAKEKWSNESPKVAVHIVVHAILKALYVDILKQPHQIERDIEECQKWEPYKKAWEIVNSEGYSKVIEQLRKVH